MLLRLEDDTGVQLLFHHVLPPDPFPRTHAQVSYEAVTGDTIIFHAQAWLHPNDQFNKFVGRKIALRRALESVPRERRTLIWKAYGKYTGAF